MQLDAVTAELRPRSDWEAVDLGIALARRDFRRVFACWWAGMLPFLIPVAILLHSHPFWLVVAIWWWTPVCSRMVLFYLSRHLFGERPGWHSLRHELPRAMVRRFGYRMLWARFSPWRPLTMAVEDLEGLRGKVYTQRVKLLMRRGDSHLITLAIWRALITLGLTLAIFQTGAMFLPQGLSEHWQEFLQEFWEGGWMEPSPLIVTAVLGATLLSMSLADIFATAIGFGIYVNHRTWIEGWDVEIALRRLRSRLSSVVGVMIAAFALIAATPHAEAAGLQRPPEEVIREIKAQPDFEVQKITVKDNNSSSDWNWNWGGAGPTLMFLGKLLLGACVFGLIAGVVWLCWRFRHLFVRAGTGRRADATLPPSARVVMGMNVTPESLPHDIPARVLELWQVGRRHEAMSLLYRGTISRLIESARVEIMESDTESDCLRRVSSASPTHEPYFDTLTGSWMRLAYARQVPEDSEVRSLCATWPFSMEGGSTR